MQILVKMKLMILNASQFSTIYQPIVLCFGRLFGLNTYCTVSSPQFNEYFCWILRLNRILSILATITFIFRTITITLHNDQAVDLNSQTISLAQYYAIDTLSVVNQIIILYLNSQFVSLSKSIDDLNPYKFTVHGCETAKKYSLALASVSAAFIFVNSAMYAFNRHGVDNAIFGDWLMQYLLPIACFYVLGSCVYPFLLLSIILVIMFSIMKTYNAELNHFVEYYQSKSGTRLELTLGELQGKFHSISKLNCKINDTFANMTAIFLMCIIFFLCITVSILWKTDGISAFRILFFILNLFTCHILFTIVAIPAIMLHNEVRI